MGLKRAWKWAKKKVNQAVTWVNDKIIQPVLKTVKNVVTNVLKDPLPYLAQIAGSFVGIPPYVTSAAITAMRGGDITDIAKSAAVAYVGSKAFSASTYGKALGETGSSVNDFTSTLAKDYGLSATTQTVLGNAAQSGFTSAALNGFKAVLTGGDVGDAITNGFVSGSVSSASNSYFGDVNNQKDWGISAETAKRVSGLTSSTGTALLTGKDPEQAMSNYVAFATTQTLDSEFRKGASYLWDQAKELSNTTMEAKSKYDTVQAKYDTTADDLQVRIDSFNAERDSVNAQRQPYLDAYSTNSSEYNKQKAIYDDTSQTVEARNAAADKMNTYAAEMQKAVDGANALNPQLDALNKKAEEITGIRQSLTDPNVGIAKELKEASEAVQTNYDKLNTTLADAKVADEEYGKQVAEVATREALVDSVNNGTLKTVDNPDAPAGSITLENGLVITADGRYLQDGKELFTNAYGVKQSGLDFNAETGEHYIFDETGKRLTSETDAQKAFEEQFGIKIDTEEAKKFAGTQYGQTDADAMKAVADAKIAEQLKQYGYRADQATIDSLIQQGGDTLANIEKAVDPYYVAQDEVNQFFQQTLGRDATPEEIIQFVGTKDEASTLDARQAAELQKFDVLQNLFGGFMPQDSLSTVNVTAKSEEQEPNRQYVYKNDDGSSSFYQDGVLHVVAPQEEYFPWESGYPTEDLPSLPPVTVTASREEDEQPLLDLPVTPLTSYPVASVTASTPVSTPLTTTSTRTPTSTSTMSGLSGTASSNTEFPTSGALPTSLKGTFLTSTGQQSKMQDFLAPLRQVMSQPQAFEQPQDLVQQQAQLPQIQEQPDMLEPFYKYGTNQSIDDIMAVGENQPQMAAGGLAGTRHGRYAKGGMATPLMAAGGKMRVDFRHGDAVTGEGDGQSDDIPAMLADGEFVFPADVVAAIGNGSTKAGSDKLYDMMHGIRAHVRSAKPQDLPPEIKSPLHFLNAKPKKARR